MATIHLPPKDEAHIEQIAPRLPDSREGLLSHAKASMLAFHAAIMAGDDTAAQEAQAHYQAVIWRLNNRTFFGCRGGLVPITVGISPRQAAEAFMLELLAEEAPVMIQPQHRDRVRGRRALPWLRQQLAARGDTPSTGEAKDGQLTWLF